MRPSPPSKSKHAHLDARSSEPSKFDAPAPQRPSSPPPGPGGLVSRMASAHVERDASSAAQADTPPPPRVPVRPASLNMPESRGVMRLLEIPPTTTHDEVRGRLAHLQFDASTQDELEAQQALEQRYVDWVATNVVEPRRRVFGDGQYRLEGDLSAMGAGAVLPASYHAGRQFLSSASFANLPQIKAVDLAALVPDPGPVEIHIDATRNSKRYVALDEAHSPGASARCVELKQAAADRRDALVRWQSALNSKPLNES